MKTFFTCDFTIRIYIVFFISYKIHVFDNFANRLAILIIKKTQKIQKHVLPYQEQLHD
jgi:hypothetical protein